MTVTHTAHQPNEFTLLSNMVGDARVLARVFLADE
jgi:acetylornithine deacetylase/succinyl-diaminopimelate desuccinylase-like protein